MTPSKENLDLMELVIWEMREAHKPDWLLAEVLLSRWWETQTVPDDFIDTLRIYL